MTNATDRLREALRSLSPAGEPAALRAKDLFAPASHAKALGFDRSLVIGNRGAGKSWWASALTENALRLEAARHYPDSGLDRCEVRSGFGTAKSFDAYPTDAAFSALAQRATTAVVWRAIVAKALLPDQPQLSGDWEKLTDYVRSHPVELEARIHDLDARLYRDGQRRLVVFDALDRLGTSDWDFARGAVRDLLKMCLEFSGYRAIRLKVFLRPDMAEDPAVFRFTDGSKLWARRVSLDWSAGDLYGLLFHKLGNVDDSAFRDLSGSETRAAKWAIKDEVWTMPPILREDRSEQQAVFAKLAGEYMGSDRRKGRTYTWVVNHLADGRGYASPRSFLRALEVAAERAPARSNTALNRNGIEDGVREASQIRLQELIEDYRWIEVLLNPLGKLSVPCPAGDLKRHWKAIDAGMLRTDEVRLPPAHLDDGADGWIQDLEFLGVLEVRADKRVNIPDIFRIATGIKRRGGVAPSRRGK